MFTRKLNSHIAATVFFDARESARRDGDRQSEKAYEAGAIKKEVAKLDKRIAELEAVLKRDDNQVSELATLKQSKDLLQKQFEAIKFSTKEDLRGLRGDVVVSKLLSLDANFFKWEITSMDNIAELIAATQKAIDTNVTPKKIEDWKKLGYTGEWSFDTDELAVATSFYEKIKNADPKTKALVSELARETWSLGTKYLKDKLIGARSVQDDSNNLSFQAKRMVDYVNQVGKGIPVTTEFAKLFKTQRDTEGNIVNRSVDLSDVNIPSLLRSLTKGHNYVSDGHFGSSEESAVKAITEFYKKNADIKPIFTQMLAYYDANMTSDHAFRGISRRESLEKSSVRTFLADLNQDGKIGNDTTNKEQRGDTAWIKESTLAKSLDWLTTDDQLVKWVNNLLSIAGELVSYKDIDGLIIGLKNNPELYPKFVQWVNIALRNGSLNQILRTGSISLLDEKTSKFIDFLETKEGTEAVKKSIKTKLDATKTTVENNPKLSNEEKQAALKAIEESVSKINDKAFLEQVSRDFSVAITNHRLGVGASSTHSLESFLADNMTVWVFVGKEFSGPSVAGLGISFDKNLISGKGYDMNLVYGAGWTSVGVTPFVGLAGRIKDWKLAAIGSGVGADIYVGKTLGNLDTSITTARELSNTSGLGKRLLDFAKDKKILASGIGFSAEEFDKTAYDKLTPEQKLQNDALAKTFSKGMQLRLAKSGYDNETNELKRNIMLQTALSDTVQQYIDTLNIDAVKGGWSIKEFGVHLGVMASIPYILPGISFGKKDVVFEEKTVKRESLEKVEGQKDIETELKKLGYSLGKPVIASDKQSYSISLEKVAGFDVKKLGKIDTNLPFDEKTLTLSNLKNWLNISLKNEVITITENNKKVDLAPTNIDTSIDALEPPEAFKKLLQERKTRVQLASLTTDRSKNGGYAKANAFIETLDKTTNFSNADARNSLITSLNAFLDVGIKADYTSLKEVRKQLNATGIAPAKFRAMIMEVRATMMTDRSQALGLNSTKEWERSTMSMQHHWDNMLNKPSPLSGKLLKDILPLGLSTTDFKWLVDGKDKEFTYNEWTIDPKMFGLVGAWKFSDAGLKFMPPGTVRVATDDSGKSYEKSLNDTAKRAVVYEQLIINPEFKSTVDKLKTATTLNDSQVKSLVTTGKVEKDGVSYTMDATFKAFAYGKCANPSYGLILGAVIRNGQNIGEPNVTGEILRVSEDYASRARFIDTNVTLLAWAEWAKPTEKAPDQTEYKTEVQVRDVQVSPTNITLIPWTNNAVVTIPGGGTIPPIQLTVAQRVAINNNLPITVRLQSTITTPIHIPGQITTPNTPSATAQIWMIATVYYTDVNWDKNSIETPVNSPIFDLSKFKDTAAYKQFLTDNKFVSTK